jgi:hypothetical protein
MVSLIIWLYVFKTAARGTLVHCIRTSLYKRIQSLVIASCKYVGSWSDCLRQMRCFERWTRHIFVLNLFSAVSFEIRPVVCTKLTFISYSSLIHHENWLYTSTRNTFGLFVVYSSFVLFVSLRLICQASSLAVCEKSRLKLIEVPEIELLSLNKSIHDPMPLRLVRFWTPNTTIKLPLPAWTMRAENAAAPTRQWEQSSLLTKDPNVRKLWRQEKERWIRKRFVAQLTLV